MRILIFIIFTVLTIFQFTCKKDITPVVNTQPEIKLVIEEVGVMETWLKLEILDSKPENSLTITRNDSVIQQFNNFISDTLIYDSGLLPNHNYTYTATLTNNNKISVISRQQLTTMDTTSHDFTWQTWTFGNGGYAVLHDVAVIAPDNIWAVGEISIEDTTGNHTLYNAVHWNGSDWELKQLLYQGGFWEIKTVYAFGENDVCFQWAVWLNGNKFIEKPIPGVLMGQSINKMWGTSKDDFYAIGQNGFIGHYNGQTWKRIESGTQDNFYDIWGIDDSLSTENPIYISAYNNLYTIDNNHQVYNMNWAFADKPIRSVWYNNIYQIFGCGENIFRKLYNDEWQVIPDTPHDDIYMISLRGQDINDIFVIGNFGLALHYNGMTWKRYFNQNNNMFRSMSYKNDVIVIVGDIWWSSPHQAIILMMNCN